MAFLLFFNISGAFKTWRWQDRGEAWPGLCGEGRAGPRPPPCEPGSPPGPAAAGQRGPLPVLYSRSVEARREGKGKTPGLAGVFSPWVRSKLAPAVGGGLLEAAAGGSQSTHGPPRPQPSPETSPAPSPPVHSAALHMELTKPKPVGNKRLAFEKTQHFIHQSVGRDCFQVRHLSCRVNNSSCSEEEPRS